MRVWRVWLLCLGLLYGVTLLAQNSKATFLSLQEGLSNQQVLDIAHDDDGFVWIATELGLNRFASNSFVTYYKGEQADGHSINSNEINTLLYDRGQLYIGTRANGLNVLDVKQNKFSYYQHDPKDRNSIATNDITDIVKNRDGKLWLATYHQGLQLFDPVKQSFVSYNKKKLPALPENSIWALAEDAQGLVYIGHVNKGLTIFNPQNLDIQHLDGPMAGLPDPEIKALFCDQDNNIWIGTRKGLAVYHPKTKRIQHIPLAAQSKNHREPFIYSITAVHDALYIGAESAQVFVVRSKHNVLTQQQDVQHIHVVDLDRGRNASVQDIAPDRFGNIWMAIYDGGIGFISHLKPFFSIFPAKDNPQRHDLATVSGIFEDRDKKLWLATEGHGVVQLDAERTEQLVPPGAATDDFLLSAFQDSHQKKWFGMRKGGVTFFDPQTKRWQEIDLGEHVTEVRAIMEDSKGCIWFAAQQGLYGFDPKTGKVEKLLINQPMLGDYAPRTVIEDSKGRIWVGTYGQGLYVYNAADRRLLKRFSTENSLPNNSVNYLYRDRNNNMWIATNEGLVFQSVNKELGEMETIVPPTSSSWQHINAIAEDSNGNIWCSSKTGLLRYLPEDKRFLSYDEAFGLPLGGFINNSVGRDSQGRLYFGMHTGVCFFEPTAIPLKLKLSPIRISRFTVFHSGESLTQPDRYMSATRQIKLRHDENSFRIELAVMDYALNDLVEFSYKLEGRSDDWIFLGSEKNLDFRNIPYGEYNLCIRMRLRNDSWSNDYQRLSITIAAPYYLGNTAILLYILLGISIISILIFFYSRKIKAEAELRVKELQLAHDEKLHSERLNFYTNITHELRTPLTLILGPLDDLLQENQLASKQRGLLQVVQKSANRLFNLVNQLLEFRKVESQYKTLDLSAGFLGEMLRDLVQRYAELNTNPDLCIYADIPQPAVKTTFDGEIIQLIIDNLMSNAIKHTKKGHIIVRLRYAQDSLSTCALIEVEDSGCGIAADHLDKIFDKFYQVPRTAAQGTGVGLALVKELVAIHQGSLSVSSTMDQGTTFCLRLLTNAVEQPVEKISVQPLESEQQAQSPHTQRPLLLLVEDDVDLRSYLVALLRAQYDVMSAENGEAGFSQAKNHIPDLVISDIMMPDMDGFGLLARLKQERETSHIPFIFLTAKDTELDRQRGYELGVDSYLQKPVSGKLLQHRIDNLLAKRKTLYQEVLQQLTTAKDAPAISLESANEQSWRENAFVQDFVNIVEAHIEDEVLDASTLAERMHMSQSTLYRKLKGITGKNINQLVRKVRIHKAAELLRSGKYNITEVSFMVGINSAVYFRQCFKEEFGQLPSEYQKSQTPR